MSRGIDFAISCIVSDEKSISLIVYWTASRLFDMWLILPSKALMFQIPWALLLFFLQICSYNTEIYITILSSDMSMG